MRKIKRKNNKIDNSVVKKHTHILTQTHNKRVRVVFLVLIKRVEGGGGEKLIISKIKINNSHKNCLFNAINEKE